MTLESRARRAAQDVHRAVERMETSMKTDERSEIERFERFRSSKDRNRTIGTIVVVTALVAIAFSATWTVRDGRRHTPAPGGSNTMPASTPIGVVTITTAGCTFDGTATVPVGPFSLHIVNDTGITADIRMFEVTSDARFDQMVAYVDRVGVPADSERHAQQTHVNGMMEFGWDIDSSTPRRSSSTISGSVGAGTYGVRCMANNGVTGWRTTDFVGPIHAR